MQYLKRLIHRNYYGHCITRPIWWSNYCTSVKRYDNFYNFFFIITLMHVKFPIIASSFLQCICWRHCQQWQPLFNKCTPTTFCLSHTAVNINKTWCMRVGIHYKMGCSGRATIYSLASVMPCHRADEVLRCTPRYKSNLDRLKRHYYRTVNAIFSQLGCFHLKKSYRTLLKSKCLCLYSIKCHRDLFA